MRCDGCRKIDTEEEVSGVKVVITGLVDDAHLAVLCSLRVRQDHVDLVPLEGNLVAVIADAHNKLGCSAHSSFSSCLILSSLRPIPVASYQCNSAIHSDPSASRIRPIPFRFRHRPGPYAFRSRGSSRIFVPAANVCGLLMDPISSKYMVQAQDPCGLTLCLSGPPPRHK